MALGLTMPITCPLQMATSAMSIITTSRLPILMRVGM